MVRIQFITLWFVLFWGSGIAQNPLSEATDRFLNNPFSAGSTIAFSVRDGRTGELIFEHLGDSWMVPASNQKLVTTAAAWSLLGPDHRIPTIIHWRGMIIDSVFIGEMVLEGHGDPILASEHSGLVERPDQLVGRWISQLKSKGILEIHGDVRFDPETFPGSPVGLSWEWSDLGSCYAQGIWPVNWTENCMHAELNRDSLGLYLTTDSVRLPWPVLASLEPGRRASQPDFLTGPPGDPTRWIGGPEHMHLPLSIHLAIPDVPGWLREELPRRFNTLGLPWETCRVTMHHPVDTWTDTVWSPPLRLLIREANTESNNLVAEALVRRLGEVLGTAPSTGQGLAQVRGWLDRRHLGSGAYLHDGSGLSRHNALTANFLTDLLVLPGLDSLDREAFKGTLAIGGESGTLSRYLKDRRLKGRIRAKTGSLNRVRCLTGYLDTREKQTYVFSILGNQFAGSTREFMALAQQWLLVLANYSP